MLATVLAAVLSTAELLVASHIYDHSTRVRSYEIVAEVHV